MKKLISLLLLVMCVALGASALTKCKAYTLKGTRCSRTAVTAGYCTQHYNMQHPPKGDERCKAITQKGTQCTRKATKS